MDWFSSLHVISIHDRSSCALELVFVQRWRAGSGADCLAAVAEFFTCLAPPTRESISAIRLATMFPAKP
jgi:hypothetical protein